MVRNAFATRASFPTSTGISPLLLPYAKLCHHLSGMIACQKLSNRNSLKLVYFTYVCFRSLNAAVTGEIVFVYWQWPMSVFERNLKNVRYFLTVFSKDHERLNHFTLRSESLLLNFLSPSETYVLEVSAEYKDHTGETERITIQAEEPRKSYNSSSFHISTNDVIFQ